MQLHKERLVEKNNTGLIHKEKDVNDFSDKILTLYNNEALRNELGR